MEEGDKMEFEILYLINNLHTPLLDRIMVFLTNLGDAGIIWIVIALVLTCMKKTRKCGILMLVSMALGLIIGNVILKNLIQRARPCWIDTNILLLIPKPTDYSFPSGHTLASFEAAIMILLHNKKWGIPAIIFAILIAFSRMYLFVHFPTDILGGIIIAAGISIAVYYGDEKIKDKKIKQQIKN